MRAQRRLASVSDKRLSWLKEQYLKLYFEDEACSGPKPAEAIKVRSGGESGENEVCKNEEEKEREGWGEKEDA